MSVRRRGRRKEPYGDIVMVTRLGSGPSIKGIVRNLRKLAESWRGVNDNWYRLMMRRAKAIAAVDSR